MKVICGSYPSTVTVDVFVFFALLSASFRFYYERSKSERLWFLLQMGTVSGSKSYIPTVLRAGPWSSRVLCVCLHPVRSRD